MEEALTFDDVLLLPGYSTLASRSEVNLSQPFWGGDLRLPIVSANMSTVTNAVVARTMYSLGSFGILSRFVDFDTQKEEILDLARNNIPAHVSLGLNEANSVSYEKLSYSGVVSVTIDTAHGHRKQVAELIVRIKDDFPKLKVIAGNVATKDGFAELACMGADAIKVGIGAGAACTTRLVTGVGVPQLTAIQNCASASRHFPGVLLIADGGVRTSGDVVKALAAGADIVMLGRMLAGTVEAPGERVLIDGKVYKRYTGQSSFGANAERLAPEGVDGYVEVSGTVTSVLTNIEHSLRSAFSYIGVRTLPELREFASFIRVSSNTQAESLPRL